MDMSFYLLSGCEIP